MHDEHHVPGPVAEKPALLALGDDRDARGRVDAHAHEHAALDRRRRVRARQLDERVDDLLRQVPEAHLQFLVGESR